MGWLIYGLLALAVSGGIGWHLGRFRETSTEMTGMMLGMTMGMLNGFILGYAAAAALNSMFWGNLFGIFFGLLLGAFFGRAGALMGVMDGAMGGVMGGSMGAMLAVMVRYPDWALLWTGMLLGGVYVLGMVALVVLIEQRAPDLAAYHRLAPLFARYVGADADDQAAEARAEEGGLVNYYELLDIPVRAGTERIVAAYQAYIAAARPEARPLAGQALGTLTNPEARAAHDQALRQAAGLGDCCPPPRRSTGTIAVPARPAASEPAPVATPPRVAPRAPARRTPPRRPASAPAGGIDWRWVLVASTVLLVVAGMVLFSGSLPGVANGGVVGGPAPVDRAGGSLGTPTADLLARALTPSMAADGAQAFSLVVNGDTMSYKPNVFKVQQGRPVRFTLSVAGRDPGCGRWVGIRALAEHGIANPGEVTSFAFTPRQTGTFEINCSMRMMQPGYLIVTD